ncbi:hypothetical protein CEXT_186691 [Caerostris extrusa]|uniref:Uncharacterized protein n=1 Tax=Caerostris extrusa TaxID=172846 RepID=A0AAV4YD98_CAEEX|nr:hypothetical protein CEXT_186691 [Caerostris extrusa]
MIQRFHWYSSGGKTCQMLADKGWLTSRLKFKNFKLRSLKFANGSHFTPRFLTTLCERGFKKDSTMNELCFRYAVLCRQHVASFIEKQTSLPTNYTTC